MFCGMNIDVHVLRVDLQRHVDERVTAFGQIGAVYHLDGLLDGRRVDEAVIDEQQQRQLGEASHVHVGKEAFCGESQCLKETKKWFVMIGPYTVHSECSSTTGINNSGNDILHDLTFFSYFKMA